MGYEAISKGSNRCSERISLSTLEAMGARQLGSSDRIEGVNQTHMEEKCWEEHQNSWLFAKIRGKSLASLSMRVKRGGSLWWSSLKKGSARTGKGWQQVEPRRRHHGSCRIWRA